VAVEAGIPPQRVYDVLERLERRGLAARLGDEWKPIPPGDALRRVAERILVEARVKAERIRVLARELEEYSRGSQESYFQILYGLSEGVAAALEALDRCRGPVYLTVYKAAEKALELLPALQPVLERLRGREVRVLVYTGARVPEEALALVERIEGVEVRAAPEAIMDMMVACDTVVIGVPAGAGDDAAALLVRSRLFAQGLASRLLDAWSRAQRITRQD